MARKKIDCPNCTTRVMTIFSRPYDIIIDEQDRLKKLRRPQRERTFEAVLNKIVSEWGLWKDHQTQNKKTPSS